MPFKRLSFSSFLISRNDLSVQRLQASPRLQFLLALCGFIVVAAVLGIYKYLAISAAIAQHSSFAPPPEAVTSLVVQEVEWTSSLSAVGSVSSPKGAILSFEEPGTVAKIDVESGAVVSADQVLVELDTSVESAQLAGARARLDLAKQELARIRTLRERNAVSKSDLDRAESEHRSAESQVNSLLALIGRKRVVAPFSGRAGIRTVNVGQYVAAGTAVIPLYSLDPLFVNFSLPQVASPDIRIGQAVTVTLEHAHRVTFNGVITAINPQVDERTRNIWIQATVTNVDEILRPGMFVEVSLQLDSVTKVIPIPSSSISFAPYGDAVYVIESMKDPHGKEYRGVRNQIVKLGQRRGEQVAILSGLKPGDEIVTSGVFKLRPGAAVAINNSLAPTNSPAPITPDT